MYIYIDAVRVCTDSHPPKSDKLAAITAGERLHPASVPTPFFYIWGWFVPHGHKQWGTVLHNLKNKKPGFVFLLTIISETSCRLLVQLIVHHNRII